MIIRINNDNTYDPSFQREDLWDGQLCLTENNPATLLIWDEEQNKTVEIHDGFLGRGEANRYLNTDEGFATLVSCIADVFFERSTDWTRSEIDNHPVCEIIAGTIDMGESFLGRHIYNELSKRCQALPDSHFASDVI